MEPKMAKRELSSTLKNLKVKQERYGETLISLTNIPTFCSSSMVV